MRYRGYGFIEDSLVGLARGSRKRPGNRWRDRSNLKKVHGHKLGNSSFSHGLSHYPHTARSRLQLRVQPCPRATTPAHFVTVKKILRARCMRGTMQSVASDIGVVVFFAHFASRLSEAFFEIALPLSVSCSNAASPLSLFQDQPLAQHTRIYSTKWRDSLRCALQSDGCITTWRHKSIYPLFPTRQRPLCYSLLVDKPPSVSHVRTARFVQTPCMWTLPLPSLVVLPYFSHL